MDLWRYLCLCLERGTFYPECVFFEVIYGKLPATREEKKKTCKVFNQSFVQKGDSLLSQFFFKGD